MIKNYVEKIFIERNKKIDSLVLGEIIEIGKENGLEKHIVLNEKAIVSALKKQIATKPTSRDLYELGTAEGYSCPNCGLDIPYTKNPKYCEDCGQALDWSNNE